MDTKLNREIEDLEALATTLEGGSPLPEALHALYSGDIAPKTKLVFAEVISTGWTLSKAARTVPDSLWGTDIALAFIEKGEAEQVKLWEALTRYAEWCRFSQSFPEGATRDRALSLFLYGKLLQVGVRNGEALRLVATVIGGDGSIALLEAERNYLDGMRLDTSELFTTFWGADLMPWISQGEQAGNLAEMVIDLAQNLQE